MSDNIPDADRRLLDAVRALPRAELPDGSRDRFLARIDALGADATTGSERVGHPMPHLAFRRNVRVLAALAAAAMLLLMWLRPWSADRSRGLSETTRRLEVLALREASPEALQLLETRLRTDPSPAVRVLSVDVLSRIAPPDSVELILTRAAIDEASPFVQASMLTAGWRLPTESAARLARELASRGSLDELLLQEASALARMPARKP